jgi:hypothetical protein
LRTTEEGQTELTPREARSGVRHHGVIWVLGISLTVIVLAYFLLIYVFQA